MNKKCSLTASEIHAMQKKLAQEENEAIQIAFKPTFDCLIKTTEKVMMEYNEQKTKKEA